MNIPKIIYKYESFSAQSLKNLKAQSIYFGSPLGFNDPYDCALKPSIKEPTNQELELFRAEYSKKDDVPLDMQERFRSANILDLRRMIVGNAVPILEKHTQKFLKNNGVSCFSEKNDDLLMWSHYGGRYKGFCLGFITEFEPFIKMKKVQYTSVMPKFDAVSALVTGNYEQILDLFCTKSEAWSYEKEWRCLHTDVGTLYTYESKALDSIYFGPDIDEQSLQIICLIIAGQNPNVKFWRGERSSEKFEVNFKEFTYISNIDSKRLGLIK
ncbi:DUF2971 domain-containing protein [Undibacterium sp. Ren11W]|uniref:DUF2971 domain-containing protein n=1 Tax=Undibacterium sp. Ren11W TaxID=3413045 RepID=UPI003BEFC67D